jgi:hypothetical protein
MDPMDRRHFFRTTGKALVIMPFGSFLIQACYGGGGGSDSDTPAAPPTTSGSNAVYTSNIDGDHSHMYTIALADFATPTEQHGQTTVSEGHSHSITVAVADLQNVEAGQSVMVTTGVSEDHTHVFTFVKVA